MTTPDSLVVFNFHQITPSFDPRFQLPQTWTSLDAFTAFLHGLRAHFDVVPLSEAMSALEERTLRGRCAAITLDDGDLSLEGVVPLLRRERIPATLFVNSGYWGPLPTYWAFLFGYFEHHRDETKRRLLTDEMRGWFRTLRNTSEPAVYRQLRERIESLGDRIDPGDRFVVSRDFLESLEPDLFTIGLHGHEHQRFAMMPQEWRRHCVADNIAALRTMPGYRPLFAIPFGRPHDWNAAAGEIVKERNLRLIFADGGTNLPGAIHCQRIPSDGAAASLLQMRAG